MDQANIFTRVQKEMLDAYFVPFRDSEGWDHDAVIAALQGIWNRLMFEYVIKNPTENFVVRDYLRSDLDWLEFLPLHPTIAYFMAELARYCDEPQRPTARVDTINFCHMIGDHNIIIDKYGITVELIIHFKGKALVAVHTGRYDFQELEA